MDLAFQIAILIMSVVVHEVAHGYAARSLGDHTAEYQGRLTLNPLKHLDPFGSVILPILTLLLPQHFVIGWAKPVPYNPYNLKPGRWSEAWVAGAGPLSNIAVATLFGLTIRFWGSGFSPTLLLAIQGIVWINCALAIFNLVPIPPLDGSKLLFAILPQDSYRFRAFYERASFPLIIIFIFFLWQYLAPVALWLFTLITGLSV